MIKSVRLTNFFSFRDCEITLEPDVTVLVGINGSGKTNLLRAFELIKAGMEGKLREKVGEWGGFDNIYCRSKSIISSGSADGIELHFIVDGRGYGEIFGDLKYSAWLLRGLSGGYIVDEKLSRVDGKIVLLNMHGSTGKVYDFINSYFGQGGEFEESTFDKLSKHSKRFEQELAMPELNQVISYPVQHGVATEVGYSVNYADFDTRPRSPMRQSIQATGLDVLDADGANLFQILNTIQLKSTEAGDAIEKDLREVNPNFDRLQFQPLGQGGMLTYLREVGLKTPIPAAHVSDGTLRYLCLLAIAHNPDRGRLICLDEPERGLHPDMLAGVARLLLDDGHAAPEAPRHTSYVVATHSPQLLSRFPLRCLRIFEKDENNQTIVRQFGDDDIARFREWYETFDAGSLWLKGELGGTRW